MSAGAVFAIVVWALIVGLVLGYLAGRRETRSAMLTVTVPLRSANVKNEKDGTYVTASGHAPSVALSDLEQKAGDK